MCGLRMAGVPAPGEGGTGKGWNASKLRCLPLIRLHWQLAVSVSLVAVDRPAPGPARRSCQAGRVTVRPETRTLVHLRVRGTVLATCGGSSEPRAAAAQAVTVTATVTPAAGPPPSDCEGSLGRLGPGP